MSSPPERPISSPASPLPWTLRAVSLERSASSTKLNSSAVPGVAGVIKEAFQACVANPLLADAAADSQSSHLPPAGLRHADIEPARVR